MKTLTQRLDELIETHALPWIRRGRRCEIRFSEEGRKQTVKLSKNDEIYVFTSIIARAKDIPTNRTKKLDLLYRAWRKNTLKELITFSLDRDDNLIGVIQQPAATMDDEELLMYLEVIAKEADRFEFKISGADKE